MKVAMNSVISLKAHPFSTRSLEEKLLIKSMGRPTPLLNIEQECKGKDRTFKRRFRSSLYEKYPWMCGCEAHNLLYCFPCLLYGGKDIWSSTGISASALSHISNLANKHLDNKKHINNVLQLSTLGISSAQIRTSTDIQEIERHNKEVDKNHYIASQMIDFLKASRYMETADGISLNLERILRNMDKLLEDSILQSKLFQEFSRLVQDDLLQCIFAVCQEIIVEELNRTKYVAVILDDTAAVSSSLYLLVIFRYEIDGNLHERFWGLVNIEAESDVDILSCILKELKNVFDSCPSKIIGLSFEGPSMMQIPADALESKIREHFPKANYILTYDHNLNTVIEHAALCNCSARKFISCLSIFHSFFCNHQRLHLLETVAAKRGIYPPPGGWDFKLQTAVSISQVQEEILECCLELQSSLCSKTVQEARILQYVLGDAEFLFWLDFFSKIMPQVENLNIELQAGLVDTCKVLQDFTSALFEIQNEVSEKCEAFSQESDQHQVNSLKGHSQKVCELITAALQYRLQSKGHFEACKLLDPTHFAHYSKNFPDKLLSSTTELYSDINKLSLHDELDVIYGRTDFRELKGALLLLQFLYFCNLEESFPETMNLLRRIVTLPVATSECDRCPGSMTRIKTFLKNSSIREHTATLVMLAAEKKMVSSIRDFNKRVLEKLANRDAWKLEFNYRKQRYFVKCYSVQPTQAGPESCNSVLKAEGIKPEEIDHSMGTM